MKATTTTPEMEAPTILSCGCNMKTFSIIYGITYVLASITALTLKYAFQEFEAIYGKFAIVPIIFYLIVGVNYFAVGFTDNPKYSKAAQVFSYMLVLMFAAQLFYLIWDLNQESSAVKEMEIEKVKERYEMWNHMEQMEADREEIKKYVHNKITNMIKGSVFGIIIQLYMASKYGENADYLEKKKQEEVKFHIENIEF